MRPYTARIGSPEVKNDGGAAIGIVMNAADGRIILVNEAGGNKKPPYFWKFPGGKIDPCDKDPLAAAIREVKEETGIVIPPDRIRQIAEIRKPTHTVFVFAALVDSFADVAKRGEEGEIVRIFSMEELESMEKNGEFLHAHKTMKRMFVSFVNA
ncbi:MAG: NUDIX hydrolase [Patescibacteria group bacterium]